MRMEPMKVGSIFCSLFPASIAKTRIFRKFA